MDHVINITIRNKIACHINGEYICGNSDFSAVFDFDDEWDDLTTKTARFITDAGETVDVLFEGNTCNFPVILKAHKIFVGVYAGDLKTSTPAYVPALKSILCDAGTPRPQTPDIYTQVLGRLEALYGKIGDLSDLTTEQKQKIVDAINELASKIGDLEGLTTEDRNNLVEAINEAYNHSSEQVQADWNEADTENPAYIKNKPSIPQTAEDVGALPITGGTVVGNIHVNGGDSYPYISVGEDLGLKDDNTGKVLYSGNGTLNISSVDNVRLSGWKVLIDAYDTQGDSAATHDFVNSSIENVAAYFITKDAAGNPFATKAELNSATVFYSGGQVRVPTRNDYTVVLADESKTISATSENPTTRYIYDNNVWSFQYIVNNSGLTAAQWAAVNSGITSSILQGLASETWVQGQGYLSATAGSAPTGVEMQNVYKATDGHLVTPVGSGGGGGTLDHRALSNREAADQHPISAIEGLSKYIHKADINTQKITLSSSDIKPGVYYKNGATNAVAGYSRTELVSLGSNAGNKIEFNATTWSNAAVVFFKENGTSVVSGACFDNKNVTDFGGVAQSAPQRFSITIPAGARYIGISIYKTNATSDDFDIVIKQNTLTLAVQTYVDTAISTAIGDTAGALSSLDNTLDGLDALIGGDGA